MRISQTRDSPGLVMFPSVETGCAKLPPSPIPGIENRMHMRTLIPLMLLACAIPAHADGNAVAVYETGTLTIEVAGPDVSMQLRLRMTRGDTSGGTKEILTTAEVVERLK